jgi:phage shock protein PspC (stress-responsive transcriptional regulator)
MEKTIVVGLSGHSEKYRLDQDAYDRLTGYLDRAASRLRDDPDRAEVLGDLERSVGDKLVTLLASGDRVVTAADIDGILEEIGAVETGRDPGTAADRTGPPDRRLRRIRKGQKIAGVCTGLAEYSQLGVDWVRTLFLLATVVTGGLFGLVYIALALMLPVVATADSAD